MFKFLCKTFGHSMTPLSQNAPWRSAAENVVRATIFKDRRYWHSHCRFCGKKRTVSITEMKPGAAETKRLGTKRAPKGETSHAD